MPVEIVAVPARASGHPHLAERTTGNVDVAEASAERVAERPVERRAAATAVALADALFDEEPRHPHIGARSRTIGSLRQRLRHATRDYSRVPLRELERMVDELAGWQARLPARSRYGIVGALRQTLGAAERWGYMRANPAKLMGPNRQPPPRPIRAYTLAELAAIVAEISPPIGRWPPSALRPGSDPRSGSRLSDATLIARCGSSTFAARCPTARSSSSARRAGRAARFALTPGRRGARRAPASRRRA
jgi:hypothetical protein